MSRIKDVSPRFFVAGCEETHFENLQSVESWPRFSVSSRKKLCHDEVHLASLSWPGHCSQPLIQLLSNKADPFELFCVLFYFASEAATPVYRFH